MEIGERRRKVGGALWLYVLLGAYTTQTQPEELWWPVSGGAELSDARMAVCLEVSESTAKKYRKRLEGAGLIRTEKASHLHFRCWIANVNPLEPQKRLDEIQLPLSKLVH